jgi:uracil-DNA glycosylase/endonuclease III
MADHVPNVAAILRGLHEHHPNATYELDWSTPEQMLVATTLAAQCTDERVNQVTKTLFVKYPSPQAFASADFDELAEDLKPTGFFRQKAQAVQGICRALVERFGGKVPRTIAELTSIHGIARKSANVVLNCCFDLPTGVIVDTHVQRVSQRMGLSTNTTPEKIEVDLMGQVPEHEWTFFGPAMVLHGRYTCVAKDPACARCPFLDQCPRKGVDTPRPQAAPAPPPPRKFTGVRKVVQADGSVRPLDSGPPATAAPRAAIPLPPSSTVVAAPAAVDPWIDTLAQPMDQPWFLELLDFVERERAEHEVFPPRAQVFSAYTLTPLSAVKVIILGQDPYHDVGQAHGLSFSVQPHVAIPPSLRNMYTELRNDLGLAAPAHGNLVRWAEQGVMLLNAVLTVRAHEPASHAGHGWERFTDATIQAISRERDHVVFLLWGKHAQKKAKLIDRGKHTILEANHPSPLSARQGFFGSKPFSGANAALERKGQAPIDWRP